jgi:hypothetical protein
MLLLLWQHSHSSYILTKYCKHTPLQLYLHWIKQACSMYVCLSKCITYSRCPVYHRHRLSQSQQRTCDCVALLHHHLHSTAVKSVKRNRDNKAQSREWSDCISTANKIDVHCCSSNHTLQHSTEHPPTQSCQHSTAGWHQHRHAVWYVHLMYTLQLAWSVWLTTHMCN